MSAVTLDDVKSKIRELAAAAPTNYYSQVVTTSGERACMYTQGECSNGTVGCIVGQALCALGFRKQCEEIDAKGGDTAEVMLQACGLKVTAKDYYWFFKVQVYQDMGFMWSDAIVVADSP